MSGECKLKRKSFNFTLNWFDWQWFLHIHWKFRLKFKCYKLFIELWFFDENWIVEQKSQFASTLNAATYNNAYNCVACHAFILYELCTMYMNVSHIDTQLSNKHQKTRFTLNSITNEPNNNAKYNGTYHVVKWIEVHVCHLYYVLCTVYCGI